MEAFFHDAQGVRQEAFFGFDWQFALTDSAAMPGEDAGWRAVQLPHDWSVDYPVDEAAPSCGSGGYARTGIGWYRRAFTAHRRAGERYALRFDGVYMNCDIWLNGVHVGGHIYGYTSFELDITDAMLGGENALLVRVDNSHQPGSRWYTGSGITRDVWLVRCKDQHIRPWGVFVTTPRITDGQADVRVQTEILGCGEGDGIRLTAEIMDGETVCACDEKAVAAKDPICAYQTLALQNPHRWDVDDPHLYALRLTLCVNGEVCDEVTLRFGVREIAYSAQNGFALNGRKLILRGVCLHHDGGCVGAAVPKAVWRRRLGVMKEMGVNALRCSHNPPDPALLDLADEMGFCVMDEAFDEWHAMKGKEFGSNTHESRGYSEWFDTCARADMTAMVERDRNHPSIVMWSIGNEVHEQVIPGGFEIARMLAGICHGLDPTRPITQACDQVKAEPRMADERFLNELDIVGVNYIDRWRERTETFFDEEKIEHPDWLLMGTEDVAVNGARGDYRLKTEDSVWGRTPYFAKSLKAEKLWKYVRTRPFVIGDFMWTGIDYLGECFWPDKGSNAGAVDTCGFPKDGFYFYQSIWREDKPVLHVFPHLNLPLEPGMIYPVVAYTNCHSVELIAGGRSYGVKAYEFPNQGMTQCWAHFDRPLSPITTNDLHLAWDVPFTGGELVAIGRDAQGNEIARTVIRPAGAPAKLCVKADRAEIDADGRDVVQLEIALLDAVGIVVPDADREIRVSVEGGELLGMDNGRADDHTLYRCGHRDTFRGLAYAVVRAPREAGMMRIAVHADGLEAVSVEVAAKAAR